MGFFKEGKSMKYKNKDGIELNFKNMSKVAKDGTGISLIEDVISEAIKMLSVYDNSSKVSMNLAIQNTKEFLKTNFDIEK